MDQKTEGIIYYMPFLGKSLSLLESTTFLPSEEAVGDKTINNEMNTPVSSCYYRMVSYKCEPREYRRCKSVHPNVQEYALLLCVFPSSASVLLYFFYPAGFLCMETSQKILLFI